MYTVELRLLERKTIDNSNVTYFNLLMVFLYVIGNTIDSSICARTKLKVKYIKIIFFVFVVYTFFKIILLFSIILEIHTY